VVGSPTQRFSGAWDYGDNGVLTPQFLRRAARLTDIADGLSQTVLLHEQSGLPVPFSGTGQISSPLFDWGPWLSLGCFTIEVAHGVNRRNLNSVFSFHPGGAQVVMCDGSVHFVSDSIGEQALLAVLTREGGEAVDPKDWAR
jgi:prepilin-type processing-associated H-X9-DG protein